MPHLASWTIRTLAGDTAATLAALAADTLRPGRLDTLQHGELLPLLIELGREVLAGTAPDLVLLASTKGDLPLWADSILSQPAGDLGGLAWIARGLSEAFACPAWVVSAACASGPVALAEAARCVRSGQFRRVLVLGGDRLASFVTEGFAGLNAVDPQGCRPFASERAGTVLSETVAAMVITVDQGPVRLQGWGQSLDAQHLTGPCRDGAGLQRACAAAMAIAGAVQPGLVIAHGTATRANDEAEAAAYAAWCPDVPVTAWKGGLGHSLGACGLTEVALAAEAWVRGRQIPGTHGNPHAGTVAAIPVLPTGWHAAAGPWLSTNAGFGGINGAVVVGDRAPRALTPRSAQCLARVQFDADATGRIPRLTSRDVIGNVDPSWGRMDGASRALVALGYRLAQQHGQWSPDAAIVLVTDAGCRETDIVYERSRRQGQPTWQAFAYTLPTAPVGEASIRLSIRGPGMALVGTDDDAARATAARLIDEGVPEVLLARIETAPARGAELAWAERWRAE